MKKTKNFLSLILVLSMVIALLPTMALPAAAAWNGTDVDTAWYTNDPSLTTFTISDEADIAGLAQLVNGGTDFAGKTILLGADLALNNTANWALWDGGTTGLNAWTPIGTYVDGSLDKPFKGTFNGQNHTISGIYISTAGDYQGLFGYCYNGSIIDLTVSHSYIKGASYVGAIAAYTMNSTISDCSSSGTVEGELFVGGVAGFNGGTISGCSNSGSVKGGYAVGGVAGACGGTGNLSGCTNSGEIGTAAEYAGVYGQGGIGGIAGTSNADISTCVNSGTVTTTGERSGGIIGSADGSILRNCHSSGAVSGASESGGIIGYSFCCTIQHCYSTGDVSGSSDYAGGIAGVAAGDGEGTVTSISQCYSMGDIGGASNSGGIAGKLSGGSEISACYSTGDISCGVQGAGGIAGIIFGSTIDNCYATGYVSGPLWLGGIAGYISAGSGTITITACMALNSGITLTDTTITVSRVAYVAKQSYAWGEMPILRNGTYFTVTSNLDGEHGLSVTAAQLKTDTYWSTAGFIPANGWTYAAGDLPTLTNTGGLQNSSIPLHIEPFPSSAGTGTVSDPYMITEAAQMAAVADYVNSGTGTYASAYYELAADIDLGRIPSWEVIGIGTNGSTGDHPFTGSFDGCGYEILNMTISCTNDWGQGLFGYIGSGGVVKNIVLTDSSVSCSTWTVYIGSVAGYVAQGAVIEGCSVTGDISGYSAVGGIAGGVFGTVRTCHTAGSVESTGSDSQFGGIAGYVGSTGLVDRCSSSAAVGGNGSSAYDCGGIAGYVNGTVQSCFSTGDISGVENSGGIAGSVGGTVLNCYASGDVSGTVKAGGIAGNADSHSSLKNCYATGGVSADSMSGNIAGTVYVDDFDSSNDAVLENCYYLTGAAPGSSEATAKTAAALATAEMAWILNTTNGMEANSGIWAQGVTPIFADVTHKAVFQVTLDGSVNPATVFSNSGGSVTLTSSPAGANGLAFLGWYEDSGYITAYTAPAVLAADVTVYGNFGTRLLNLSNDMSTHTYNGAAVSFSGALTDNASGVTGASGVLYTYYTDQSGTLTTTANSGAASVGAAPKNTGTYYVKATTAANTVAGAAESGYASMTISKANPVITITIDHPSGQKYGQDVTVTVTVAPTSGTPTDGFPTAGEMNLDATGATIKTALAATANPGVYSAVYTMPGTYSPGQQAVLRRRSRARH